MNKPAIHLVLGSGGARGLAHIGVIEELLVQGYTIKSVTGSSMGALVGGVYCAGHLDTCKEWFLRLTKMEVFRLVDLTLSRHGFVKGDRVFNTILQLIGEHDIENFNIPFTAIAADLINRKEITFNSGSLLKALRASVAIPTIITPVITDGNILVDGGVLNPLPFNYVKREPGEWIIAVNVNGDIPLNIAATSTPQPAETKVAYQNTFNGFFKKLFSSKVKKIARAEAKIGYIDLLNQSFDLMQDHLTRILIDIHKPEVLINIGRNSCSAFEFYRAKELIDMGTEACRKALEIKQLNGHATSYPLNGHSISAEHLK